MRRKSESSSSSTSFSRGGWKTSLTPPTVTLTLPLGSSVTVPNASEQGSDVTPLDVRAGAMVDDLLEGLALLVVEVVVQAFLAAHSRSASCSIFSRRS